jgi:hypothetical protein
MNAVVQLLFRLITRTCSPASSQKKGVEISPFEVGSMIAGNIYNSHFSSRGLPESLKDLKIARRALLPLARSRNPNDIMKAARLVIVDIVPALNRLMPRTEILLSAQYGKLGKSGREKLRESILSIIASMKALALTPPDQILGACLRINKNLDKVINTISNALVK